MPEPTPLPKAAQKYTALITALAAGNYRDVAFRGTRLTTKQLARTESNPKLVKAIQEAEAKSEFELLSFIRSAAQKPQHWTAAAWMLERRHPDRWAQKKSGEDSKVTVLVGVQLQQLEGHASPKLVSSTQAKVLEIPNDPGGTKAVIEACPVSARQDTR